MRLLPLFALFLLACDPAPATSPDTEPAADPADATAAGSAELDGGPGASDGSVAPMVPVAPIAIPNPRISRGRPITSSAGATSLIDGQAQPISTVNDGTYSCCDGFRASASSWLAIDLGAGPTRVLVTWLALGQPDAPSHQPIDYHLDVSPDGASWTTRSTITGNDTNARENAIDFAGQRFVRLVVDKAEGGVVQLVELEVYDISHGSDDTWVFLGDSITAMSMNPPLFSELVHAARPAFTPMMIGAAIGGTQTTYALDHIDEWIARFPDVRNFAVAYGTNDAGCDATGAGASGYLSRLQTLVDKLKAAGKRVLIPHIPWNEYCAGQVTALGPYNAGIDSLRTKDSFVAGPDLYTWFASHQSQLGPDHVHPGNDGVTAINQLWAATAASLY